MADFDIGTLQFITDLQNPMDVCRSMFGAGNGICIGCFDHSFITGLPYYADAIILDDVLVFFGSQTRNDQRRMPPPAVFDHSFLAHCLKARLAVNLAALTPSETGKSLHRYLAHDVFRFRPAPPKKNLGYLRVRVYSTAFTMSSMTFFASPKTIMVLSR